MVKFNCSRTRTALMVSALAGSMHQRSIVGFHPINFPTRILRSDCHDIVERSFLLAASDSTNENKSDEVQSTTYILEKSASFQDQASNLMSSSLAKINNIDWKSVGKVLVEETLEVVDCAKLAIQPIVSNNIVDVQLILKVCDELDDLLKSEDSAIASNDDIRITEALLVRRRALEFRRYELLAKLMQQDYDSYVTAASFLSPSRIPRNQLPNVQDIPVNNQKEPRTLLEDGLPLVADCELENVSYAESPLDKLLLSIFRKLVTKNTGGITSSKDGILGLLEQGRNFMLQPNQTAEAQHIMVQTTLGELMTPVLPPFYRIFMSGIVPKLEAFGDLGGKQPLDGPLPYASWLTSFVTPTFFGFLVGPSYPNRRKDGQLGGLLVEKCKFLQESGCKGLCLHQCKIPAQNFFANELGLPLTVSPNFVTQECQWSFGEVPVPHEKDPSFPRGCLAGCESRKSMAVAQSSGGFPTGSICS